MYNLTYEEIVQQFKKIEPAPSANGTSSANRENSTTDIIPEISADVNACDEISADCEDIGEDDSFCCEVTGDTDFEAYMADRERFFAAKRSIPDAVLEACRCQREVLTEKVKSLTEEADIYNAQINALEKFLKEHTGAAETEVQK